MERALRIQDGRPVASRRGIFRAGAGRAARAFRASRSRGVSLIEVMISIFVLSFGLLGMVGLQAAALQGNRDARQQSEAISLARELAEMMRGNKDVATKLAPADNPYLFTATTLAVTVPSHCLDVGSNCVVDPLSPAVGQAEIASAQMTDWLDRVKATLPGAKVVVCFDNAPFDSDGLPVWGCTAGTDATVMIKIGWTRGSTNRSRSNTMPLDRVTDANSRPSVVLPVTPGNTV